MSQQKPISAIEPQEQEQLFMVNPFAPDSGESELANSSSDELGNFLKWAHSQANPFSEDFLMEVQNITRHISNYTTVPERLGPGLGVVVWLEMLIELAQAEKARLEMEYQEFKTHQTEAQNKYTEAEAADWLKANMPEAYARITRKTLFEPVKSTNDKLANPAA